MNHSESNWDFSPSRVWSTRSRKYASSLWQTFLCKKNKVRITVLSLSKLIRLFPTLRQTRNQPWRSLVALFPGERIHTRWARWNLSSVIKSHTSESVLHAQTWLGSTAWKECGKQNNEISLIFKRPIIPCIMQMWFPIILGWLSFCEILTPCLKTWLKMWQLWVRVGKRAFWNQVDL